MKRFQLKISCENAAFDEYPGDEIETILHALADRLAGQDASGLNAGSPWSLVDSNGNAVGVASVIGFGEDAEDEIEHCQCCDTPLVEDEKVYCAECKANGLRSM